MNFVVDAQLPPALANWLRTAGFEADHVCDLDLLGASDRAIWDFASTRDAVIITKDRDFVDLATVQPQGPRVIWVRLGNTLTPQLISRVAESWAEVLNHLQIGDRVVELS